MNWSEIRSYIIQRVAVVDSDLSEWREAFNIENVPGTLIDTHFQITFNNIDQVESNGQYIADSIGVTISIWKDGCNEPVDAMDTLLDKALCIRQEIIRPSAVQAFGWNGFVSRTTVTPFPIDETNDNKVRVAIEFTLVNYLNI